GLLRGLIHIRTMDLHEALGLRERREAQASVELLLVARRKQQTAQAGEMRMHQRRADEPGREPLPAMRRQHEDVGEVSECRLVGDEAREADLRAALVQAEAERMRDGALDELARDARRPVARGEEAVDDVEIELPLLVGDLEGIARRR